MPRKVRLPASPTQSRANQQRCRARRREHLADLERRVREYEARDAQASVEMQAASRKVVWRNEMLLGLLWERFGVARADAERWLDAEWEQRMKNKEGEEGEGVQGAEAGDSGGGGGGGVVNAMLMSTTMATAQVARLPQSPPPRLLQDTSECASRESRCPRNTSLTAEMTSCDEAADMIANLQGNGDVSSARRLLGCPSSSKCQVKNTKLFELMVETS